MADHPTHPDIHLVEGAFYAADPHRHWTWMREHAPVYWDDAGRVWGITRYDDVLGIAKDPRTFTNSAGIRPDAPPMPYMIDLDDPEHKRRRNIVNKGFTVRRVAEREPRIREICVDLIERVKERRRFDFVMDFAAWLPLIVIGDMLGVDPAHYPSLLRWSDDMLRGTGTTDPDQMQRSSNAFIEYADYQRQVIDDRHTRGPQGDLVSLLVHADVDGERLTHDQVLMESLLILIGGDETTRHVITGGMYELFKHPDQLRLLAENPAKIPVAVEEMLRWVTPIQNMARTATRDVEIRGQQIHEGDRLLLLYGSANRDEDVFNNPFGFSVERTPNDHLAFGFGPHFCLGASLARLELRVMFEELLARMPTLQLVSDQLLSMRPSNFITGIEHLEVEWRG